MSAKNYFGTVLSDPLEIWTEFNIFSICLHKSMEDINEKVLAPKKVVDKNMLSIDITE